MIDGSAIDSSVAPLDAARRRILQLLGPVARPFLIDRDARIALFGAIVCVTALAATLVCPLWLLALGPIIFGVPHLLSDVRYLVVRPGLHRRWTLWLGIGAPLAAVSVNPAASWGLLAVAGALAASRGRWSRRAFAFAAWAVAYFAALRYGRTADLIVAHAHNVLAILLWWWWRPRGGRTVAWIAGLFLIGTAIIFSGLAEPLIVQARGMVAPASGLAFGRLVQELVPWAIAGADPSLALRIVLWFTFAQSVHYGMWLRLIPEEDRPRRTPRSFRATLRALRNDFGLPALLATAAMAIALAVWAGFDLLAARNGYLRASFFHGYLELAVAALLWTEGLRPGRATLAPAPARA